MNFYCDFDNNWLMELLMRLHEKENNG